LLVQEDPRPTACLLVLGYEHFKTGWVILPMGLIVLAVMFLGGFVWQRRRLGRLFRGRLVRVRVVGLWLGQGCPFPASRWGRRGADPAADVAPQRSPPRTPA